MVQEREIPRLRSAALGMTTEKLRCRNVIGPRAGDSSAPLHSARNDNGCLSSRAQRCPQSSRAQRCPSHREGNAAPVITSATQPPVTPSDAAPSHSERRLPLVISSVAKRSREISLPTPKRRAHTWGCPPTNVTPRLPRGGTPLPRVIPSAAAPVITSAAAPESLRAQLPPSHSERCSPQLTPSAAVPESFRAPPPPCHFEWSGAESRNLPAHAQAPCTQLGLPALQRHTSAAQGRDAAARARDSSSALGMTRGALHSEGR